MAVTDYYNKQGPTAVMPSWYESVVPAPEAQAQADMQPNALDAAGAQNPSTAKKDVFGAPVIKPHGELDLSGSAPTSTTPAASAATPAASSPAPTSVIDYSAKMRGAESRANALNTQTDAARTAMTDAQKQQIAAYDAVPYRPTGFYETLFKQLTPYKPKTAAEIQRDLKRERNNKMIAAIGDGISALANLWGTSQGALNAYDGKQTLSQRYSDIYDKLRAERKANDEKYAAQYMAAMGLDDTNANARRQNEIARGGVIAQNARLTYSDLLSAAAREQARADQLGQQWQTQSNFTADFNEKQRQFDKNYEETVRAHKASEALQAQSNSIHASSVALQRRQFEHQLATENVRLVLNNDSTIDVKSSYLHGGTLDRLVQQIGNDVSANATLKAAWDAKMGELRQGEAVTNVAGQVVGYKEKPLTDADRLILVQDFIENSPKAQSYIKQVQSGKAQSNSEQVQNGKAQTTSNQGHKSNPYA